MRSAKTKSTVLVVFSLLIALILGLCFTVNIAYAKSSDFQYGEGTESDPYIISTPSELNNVRYHRDAYFLQTANLDMADFGDFAPIGSVTFPFTGHYDGGKYSITNLAINSNDNNVGLFSVIYDGTVENLKIKGSKISGAYNVGAIAGTNKGTIRGCIAVSIVSGVGAVGGVVGLNSTNGTVAECGNLGIVKCETGMYSGGIVGINDSKIENCYNYGDINVGSENSIYSGGLTGFNNGGGNAEINNSYSVGELGGKARGQIVGDNNGKINGCFYEKGEFDLIASFDNGQITDTKGIDRKDFSNPSTFKNWNDFNRIWMYINNGAYPILAREYVAVESVEFSGNDSVELKPGEAYTFDASVKPVHATAQNITFEVIDNDGSAIFDSASKTIKIKDSAKIGSTIRVMAIAESRTAELNISVVKIPVTQVKILSVTGRTSISAGSSLAFKTEIFPYNASNQEVVYSVNSSYASIDEKGILTVKDGAPLGAAIVITATSKDNGNAYDSLTLTVVGEPVQSVTIDCADSFKVTESLLLTAAVYPANATNKDVTYEIISATAKGARLIGDALYAEGLGEIAVKATADGVSSEIFTVIVLKQPVAEIEFNAPNGIICGEGLPLIVSALPYNATYRKVTFEIIENNANAEIIDGILYAKRDGAVVVRASADGVVIDKTIIVDKIPVESVKFNCADTFKHTESLPLNVTVKPNNATYPDITYTLIENTAEAYIENGVLFANKPGLVTLRAEADGVTVEKTVTVLKESVTNIALTADYVDDERGEALQFSAAVYPQNATYQDVSYYLKSGPAALTADGYLLIDITAPIGSIIEVYAEADGVKSEIYVIRAGKISVKSVSLESSLNSIKIGQGAALTVSTNPALVSNPGVTFIASGGAEVVDGMLYVYDKNTVGKSVTVTAVVDGVESNTISIFIEKTPVQAVGFTCGTSFKVTENMPLNAKVYPTDATYPTVTYSVVSDGDSGAAIIDGCLYAERPGVIKIRASADGVTRELIVHALKEPAKDVVLNSVKSVKVNNELNLKSTVYPFNATYKSVRYELIDNSIGAEIWDGNIFYSANVGKVKVRVYVDEIYRDFEIEAIKEPVVDIKMPGSKSFKHTERLKLSAYVIPFNATYSDVTYEIVGGGDFAYIADNCLYASRPGIVTLKLSADGVSVLCDVEVTKNAVTGVEFTGADNFALTKGYQKGEIGLKSAVYPSDATYPEVVYEIAGCYNCNAEIIDGKLRIISLKSVETDSNGYAADEQATVTVRATADGVYTERTFVVRKNKVDNVTITRELQTSPLTNGAWRGTESDSYKTSGVMRFSVNVLSEYATYKNYIVSIDGNKLLPNKNDGMYYVSADTPCTKTVTVTSLCGGKSWNFDFIIAEEKVDRVYLGTEVEFNKEDADKIIKEERGALEVSANSETDDIIYYKNYSSLEVQQGSQISIRPFASAANPDLKATYGNRENLILCYEADGVSYKFASGEDNRYFSYNGNIVTVKVNAPVNKSIYLYAKSKDGAVTSDKTQIKIQSKYITEIKGAYLDGNGKVCGLENLYNRGNNTSDIVKVKVSIKHSSGIEINKEIITKDPTMRLQLYNPSLGGSFTISYTVYFEENGNSYSYTLAGVKSFGGIKENAYYQKAETEYNAIVLFDFYSGSPKQELSTNSNVKAVYVYGSGASKTIAMSIATNTENATDLYFNNICIQAPVNTDAITILNDGSLNLHTLSTVKIYGGNGSGYSKSGKTAIYSSKASLNIYNDGNLTLSGGNGNVGQNGVSYNVDKEVGKGKGPSPSGGDGTSGGSGGEGIAVRNLALKENHNSITINGGIGANGGNGGNGSGSDRDERPDAGKGGDGGRGGDGGYAIIIYDNFELNLNSNRLIINGGNAGDGGAAGHGGHGLKEHYSDNGGRGGDGGNGGAGGYGILAYSITGNFSGNIQITTGNGGRGRNGGNGGNGSDSWGKSRNGKGGSGGDSGSSGDGVVRLSQGISLAELNSHITLGSVYSGGNVGADGEGGNAASGTNKAGTSGQMGDKIYG